MDIYSNEENWNDGKQVNQSSSVCERQNYGRDRTSSSISKDDERNIFHFFSQFGQTMGWEMAAEVANLHRCNNFQTNERPRRAPSPSIRRTPRVPPNRNSPARDVAIREIGTIKSSRPPAFPVRSPDRSRGTFAGTDDRSSPRRRPIGRENSDSDRPRIPPPDRSRHPGAIG